MVTKTLEERMEALKTRAGKVTGAILPTTLEKAEVRLAELEDRVTPEIEEKIVAAARELAEAGIDPSKDRDFGPLFGEVRRLHSARERVAKHRASFEKKKAKNEARAAKLAKILEIIGG